MEIAALYAVLLCSNKSIPMRISFLNRINYQSFTAKLEICLFIYYTDFTTKEKEHKIAGQLQENAKRTCDTAVRKNEKEAKKSISSLMLQNISFSTYAKLMRMEESALVLHSWPAILCSFSFVVKSGIFKAAFQFLICV
mgnify:CR=1 FL=1